EGKLAQLVFGDTKREHRHSFGKDTRSLQPLIERLVAISYNGADDDIGFRRLDRLDGRLDLGTSNKDICLTSQFGTQSFELVLDDFVDAVRPNIIRPNQEELPLFECLITPSNRRNNLLIWRGAGVNDVWR